MGNIAAGHDLIKRKTGKDAFGLLLPLVTAESGQKFGTLEPCSGGQRRKREAAWCK